MPIKLINVQDLFGKTFVIPFYQRGYRWNERQIEDLLKDILEFQKRKKKDGEFYCLQPIVIKRLTDNEEKYEVIDGQQRLTTILFLLHYFRNRINEDFNITNFYSLEYQTRVDLQDFFDNLQNEQNNNKINDIIDCHYIRIAWIFLKNWINQRVNDKKLNKSDYLNTILKEEREIDAKEEDRANNIRFIWYEVDSEENGQKIFTRINRGKIPLTNAELIKALFFINENQEDKEKENYQTRRSYIWESIENKLQDDKFWYFLNGDTNETPTRIDLIFDLIAKKYEDKISISVDKTIDRYFAFYILNELITNKIDIEGEGYLKSEDEVREKLWEKVKEYFSLLEEWFNDYNYYHFIGYLINTKKVTISELVDSYENYNKSKFIEKLKSDIKDTIFGMNNSEDIKSFIEDLSYGEDNRTINNVLLLFNILLTMQTGYVRFPFDKYVKDRWSLEHIHAQKSEEIKRTDDRKQLLKEQIAWLSHKNQELVSEIKNILQQSDIDKLIESVDDEKFNRIENIIFKEYSDGKEYSDVREEVDIDSDINSIDNLTLLSVKDNSALKNNIFPIKREKIIEMDKNGHFIPIATKNIFLKYFSKNPENYLKWTKSDREAYRNQIIETLNNF